MFQFLGPVYMPFEPTKLKGSCALKVTSVTYPLILQSQFLLSVVLNLIIYSSLPKYLFFSIHISQAYCPLVYLQILFFSSLARTLILHFPVHQDSGTRSPVNRHVYIRLMSGSEKQEASFEEASACLWWLKKCE